MDDEAVKEIKVLTPNDWPAATEVRKTFVLDTQSAAGSLAFNLRAISTVELRELEEQTPLPEAPVVGIGQSGVEDRDFSDSTFQAAWGAVHFSRWVMWLDKCWKPLPGTTQSEKVKWAEENLWRNGEIAVLFNAVRKLSGLGTGQPATSQKVAVIEADPETWAKASQAARLAYRIPHDDAKQVLVFELTGLSQLKVNQIRETCQPPEPPMMPERHKMTKKPIPGTERPDRTDPGYQKALKESVYYENCLLLEASLFPFPGSTREEKRAWLDQRPAFEVSALLAYLTDDVIGYRGRVESF